MHKMLLLPLVAVIICLTGPDWARADVVDYCKIPDKEFRWELKGKSETDAGTIYDLHLVSQVWHDVKWEHQVQVFLPKEVKPGATMFLFNQGGKANSGSTAFGMEMARKMGAPVAIVYGIPNQPIFGKTEDGLIAETFVKYLDTKDPTWPLLFPMAKSLVRAMDALQEFAKQEWKVEVRWFVVSGGSKRGWTTWLTGAADPRVKAIAPLVIDTLNMVQQMDHQWRSYGKYSAMIGDYTTRGLVPMPKTPEADKLWKMVDPWNYRDKLKMPILMINGANDPYWTVDALNLYWDGLKSEKWVLYVPNAGHDLTQKVDGKPDRSRVQNALAAFTKAQAFDKALPKLSWKHDDNAGKLRLTVKSDVAPAGARLWVARAPTRDFRRATWEEQPATIKDGTVVGELAQPTEAFLAFFGELDFTLDGQPYSLSTQIRVAGKGVTGWTDPQDKSLPTNFRLQGEYTGTMQDGAKLGAQIIALGNDALQAVVYPGGLPGDGWDGTNRILMDGAIEGARATFAPTTGKRNYLALRLPDFSATGKFPPAGQKDYSATIADGILTGKADDGKTFTLKRTVRNSPTLGQKAPAGALVLFDGTSTDAFNRGRLDKENGILNTDGSDIVTKKKFQNYTVHCEFMLPYRPDKRGQERGNSGFYMVDQYEVQILDSFGLDGKNNECGGIYTRLTPKVNMCLPALQWQTYDIDFTAAAVDESGKKTKNARITVRHNGVVIHDDAEIPGTTGGARNEPEGTPGVLRLQGHGNPVQFRNIWVVERK
jgi:PhoPQ-activated pathogenicity-related protein